ncbi:MAG: MFS transporter [Acidimicrobiales bacterium]|nr:MFS transporter [Acidimicrobiales bacterium]
MGPAGTGPLGPLEPGEPGEPRQRQGTGRDALANPDFRRIYVASFISNAGRWMQTIAVGVLGWELTGSNAFLGQLIFAQLIPLAFLSLIGGGLADTMNKRILLTLTQLWQLVFTLLLAVLLLDGEIAPRTLVVIIFLTGLGQGIYAPAFNAVLPTLVGAKNLTAAVSLNSVQVNGARIIGPAIGGVLVSRFGFAEVFFVNAATYLAVIGAVIVTSFPDPSTRRRPLRDRLLGGFVVAARAPQVARPLLIMTMFSLFCLPFIGQLPAIAETRLGFDAQSTLYGYFYAFFGLGALVGALMVGTVLLNADKAVVTRVTLVLFAGSMAALATVNSTATGFAAIFFVGLFYFAVPTTLNTRWQEHVDDSVRGRVAALWVLSFGGTVPIANLLAGAVVEATSLGTIMAISSIMAVVMAASIRLPTGPRVGEDLLD